MYYICFSIFTYIHIQYIPYIHVGREHLKASFESSWWKSPVLFVTRPWYFCPCLKVDHYLNNSKMHPVTLKFWKKPALSLPGVLELPILRGSWFCCFVSIWPKWTFWSHFFGGCVSSRKAGNLWIYKQVPKPPGPNSVGWLLHFDPCEVSKKWKPLGEVADVVSQGFMIVTKRVEWVDLLQGFWGQFCLCPSLGPSATKTHVASS